MRLSRISLWFFIVSAAGTLFAQNDYKQLKGTITAASGTPLSKALVVLPNKGKYTLTNSNGVFDFSNGGITSIQEQNHFQPSPSMMHQYRIKNDRLSFSVTQPTPMVINLFDVKGALISQVINAELSAGSYSVSLAPNPLSHQLYVLSVTNGMQRSVFRYVPQKNSVFGVKKTYSPQTHTTRSSGSQGIDIVKISHPGYLSKVVQITSFTDPVAVNLEQASVKVGTPAIVNGTMDRLSLFGKTQYFWAKVGNKDIPMVKIISAATDKAVDVMLIFNPSFVDLTYGANAVGWKKHSFRHLVQSDHVEIALRNGDKEECMKAKIDLLSSTSLTKSGYACLGVFGGDGSIINGNPGDIYSFGSSFDDNINFYGYHLFESSPKTDSIYTANPKYPYWEYYAVYHLTVKSSVFGSSGYSNVEMTYVHASPSKNGNETVQVVEKDIPDKKINPFIHVKKFTVPDID